MAAEADIHAERIRAVFQQTPVTVLVTMVNAALMTVVLIGVEHERGAYVWLAGVLGLAVLRLMSCWAYRRARPQPVQLQRWAVVGTCGALASGLLWGGGAVVLLPQSETYQLLWIFLIGGMCAGAAVFYAAHLPTTLAYILPAGLPLAVRFAAEGSERRIVAAAMIAVFLAALVFSSRRSSLYFGDMLRLRFDLAQRTSDLDALNSRLRREMAEHRATEATLHQAQKMDAVGQLTGGIAHDFNNVLQAIGGCLEMLQRRVEQGRTDEALPYLEAARKAVEHAAALTHRLLTFARRQQLQPRAVDPDELIESMADLVRRLVGPAITVELRLRSAWTVLCDLNQLESALLNLAINARDAMPEGGWLTLSTDDVQLSEADVAGQEGAEPGGYVEIAVADTGTGMDKATRMRAFEPFFTTKPLGQGTGLGLSQLYGFVRQSGGVARLDSAPGQGTAVRLYLPQHEQAHEQQALLPAAEPELPGAGGTVLLVEDEATVRAMAAERLRELGCDVLEAADGPAALRLLRSGARVDVLVTNLGLPSGLNGRQVADVAREHVPDLPVLFITGHPGSVLEGHLAPGMEVIGKPFALDTLAARNSGRAGNSGHQVGSSVGLSLIAGPAPIAAGFPFVKERSPCPTPSPLPQPRPGAGPMRPIPGSSSARRCGRRTAASMSAATWRTRPTRKAPARKPGQSPRWSPPGNGASRRR